MNEDKIEAVGDSLKLDFLSNEKEEISTSQKYVSSFYKSPQSTISKDILTFQ